MSDKKARSAKEKQTASYAHGDALLLGLAGFGLSYLVLVPHTFAHYIHWAWAGGSGLFAYLAMWLWLAVIKPWRTNRMITRMQQKASRQKPRGES